MDSLPELDLARALLNSGYPVILPPSCVVQKLSTSKEALWVRFTSPCEYAGKTIQMYTKSLEPKKGLVPILAFYALSLVATPKSPRSEILA